MTYVFLILVCGVILFTIGKILYEVFDVVRITLNHLFRHPINRYLIIRNIDSQYQSILHSYFPYFKELNRENQVLFEKRVQKFIDKKNFVAVGELEEVTPEMKTLIAASAIQLTFGLPGVYFERFKDIHIHPGVYYSERMEQYNAGEVHKHSGLIIIGWRQFLKGYVDLNDAKNLGLHEMAHALRFENMIKNQEYGYFDWDDIQLLNEFTVEETEKVEKGEFTLFCEYAASHYQEFFAVLIEIFFEQPHELKSYHYELYTVTCRLLRQDPMRPNERYR